MNMEYKVVFSEQSEKDLRSIYEYIAVKLLSPTDADSSTDGIQVNGTISFSGTISDDNVLPDEDKITIVLQYWDSVTWLDIYKTAPENVTDTIVIMPNLSISGTYSFTVSGFDTTELKDGTTYYLRAVAKDKAGNEGKSAPDLSTDLNPIKNAALTLNVSQDSDRPKVNINNLFNSDSLGKYLLKHGTNAQVTGRISDDDSTATAVVASLVISETAYTGSESFANLATIDKSTGEFTFTPSDPNDGTKTFYIYIEDNAGGKFYTTYNAGSDATETTKYLKCPKILLNGTAQAETVNSKVFSYLSDSLNPSVVLGKGLPYSSSKEELAKDFSGNVFAISDNNSNLSASFLVGGTERKYVKFYFTGNDASGIEGMTLELSTSDGTSLGKYATAEKIADETQTGYTVDVGTNKGKFLETSNGDTEWTTDYIDVSGWESGQISVAVKLYDRVGLTSTGTYSFAVDNSAPTISVNSPENNSEQTGEIIVEGIANDSGSAGTNSVQWYIPKTTETDNTACEYKGVNSGTSNTSWKFKFDGEENSNPVLKDYDSDAYDSDGDTSNGIYKLKLWLKATDNLGNTSYSTDFAIRYNPDADKPVLKFSYPTSNDYDENQSYVTLGGTIRVTGTASIPNPGNVDPVSIKRVYYQIADATGSFTDTDKEKAASTLNGGYGYTVVTALDVVKAILGNSGLTVKTDDEAKNYGFSSLTTFNSWWGIECDGTSAWNFQINKKDELNPTSGTNNTNNITLRACGVNSKGKFGAWTAGDDLIAIHIDNAAPTISSMITQYDSASPAIDTTPSVSQEYTADMYLRGSWYIALIVLDESGISSKTVKKGSSSLTESAFTFAEITDTDTGKTGYKFLIPISTDNEGEVSYTVSVTDKDTTAHTATQTFTFNIDNTAPTLDDIKDTSGTALKPTETNTLENKNYVYTLSGKSFDDGSGVEHVVFYYMRKSEITQDRINNEVLLDPMITPTTTTTDGVTTTTYSKVKVALPSDFTSVADDGIDKLSIEQKTAQKPITYYLYARKKAGTMSAVNSFTSTTDLDAHVRVGGLIKIGGLYRTITAISGNEVTFTPSMPSAADTTAWFPIAQVIDANNTASSNSDNPFKFDSGKDDGDFMPESFTKSGSTWTWDASIHSDNIPDGPATLVVLAFDNAGNVAGSSYTMMVANNAPRIAKVFLATDLNHNGAFDESEFETYNIGAQIGNNNGTDIYSLKTAGFSKYVKNAKDEWEENASSRKSFTIKNGLAILPEIVGGNSTIKLVFNNNDTTTDEDGKTTGTATEKTATLSGTITGDYWKLTDLGDDSSEKKMSFTFWDSTEETTSGTNSQYAFLRVTDFIVDQTDDVAPNVVVNPFYWESAGDNSLYGNSSANGHIELEADLTKAITDLYKSDPKVSGKIVLRGTAYDETYLNKLSFTMTNFDSSTTTPIVMATYDNSTNKWNTKQVSGSAATMASNHYEVTVDDDYFDQNGHKVNWSVAIDTAHLSDVAHLNAVFTVIANDLTNNDSTNDTKRATSGTTDGTTHKPSYQMDVVPYITGIATPDRTNSGLKSNNIRSASGKYSIIKGTSDTFITVTGFNLNVSDARVVKESRLATLTSFTSDDVTLSPTEKASDYTSFKGRNNLTKSGYLEVLVNGVRALNNINDDNAYGTATNTAGAQLTKENATVSDYANAYNREPDYYTTKNVQLTDDRYIRFFDMHTAQTPSSSNTWTNLKNAYYPVMVMNGDNPVFGYMNGSGGPNVDVGRGAGTGAGSYYPSHAMPQRAEFNGSSGAEVYTEYLIKASAWDAMGMAVDEGGRYYNVSCYNRDGAAMSLIYDRYAELYTNGQGWGAGTGYSGYSGNSSNGTENNAITLDSMNYSTGVLLGRYMYPKLIANGNSKSGTAKVYMAYYDDGTGEIVFRNFQLGTTVSGTATALAGNTLRDNNNTRYGQYVNFTENTGNSAAYSTGRLTAVATGSKYYDMAVTSDNHVVIVYYDEGESKLKLLYSTNAVDGSSPTSSVAWTTSSVSFPSYAGTYVSMAIDSSDGLHIAAFDASDADLKYFYLPSYSSTDLADLTVDAAGSVGHWTGIAICTDTDNAELYGKPVISYYNSTETGTRESIKMAYPKAAIGSITAGVDSNGYTTGAWEYMTVPAITPPQGGDSKFQKVCLGFDTKGIPVLGFCATNLEFGKWLTEEE